MTREDYKKAFGLADKPVADAKCALEVALDVRKFEIDLYWKRATYFWAFLAVALGAYFALLTAKDISTHEKGEALLIVSCLGIVFSIAWYFVNRASKYWQENWENHVDQLEDGVHGPIYKTVLSEKVSFLKFWAPYPFSVSKINQLLSLFLVFLFVLLAAETLHSYYSFGLPGDFVPTAMVILTIAAVTVLWCKGRTTPHSSKTKIIQAERRNTEIK